MERIGLDYESVRAINPAIVYASATGYGTRRSLAGPARAGPARPVDLGHPWLSGSKDDGPVPVGLSIADHLLSCHIAQGVTALLVRRFRTGRGRPCRVQPARGDAGPAVRAAQHPAQRRHDPRRAPRRALGARLPRRAVRHLSDQRRLSRARHEPDPQDRQPAAGCPGSRRCPTRRRRGTARRRSRRSSPSASRRAPTAAWLAILDAADVWCAPVLTLDELIESEGFAAIAMTQQVTRRGTTLTTTRSPLRIDGEVLTSAQGGADPRRGRRDGPRRSSRPRRDIRDLSEEAHA